MKTFNYSLPSLLSSYFSKNKSLTALAFQPLLVSPCSVGTSRLNSWGHHARLGAKYEVKLILRTAAVRTFFVHYITELEEEEDESNRKDYEPLVMNISLGALLHYRNESLSIFGQILGKDRVDVEEYERSRCRSNGVIGYRSIRQFQDDNFLRLVSDAVSARVRSLASWIASLSN